MRIVPTASTAASEQLDINLWLPGWQMNPRGVTFPVRLSYDYIDAYQQLSTRTVEHYGQLILVVPDLEPLQVLQEDWSAPQLLRQLGIQHNTPADSVPGALSATPRLPLSQSSGQGLQQLRAVLSPRPSAKSVYTLALPAISLQRHLLCSLARLSQVRHRNTQKLEEPVLLRSSDVKVAEGVRPPMCLKINALSDNAVVQDDFESQRRHVLLQLSPLPLPVETEGQQVRTPALQILRSKHFAY